MQNNHSIIYVLGDDVGKGRTQKVPGVSNGDIPVIFLHKVSGGDRFEIQVQETIVPDDQRKNRSWRAIAALGLIDKTLKNEIDDSVWIVAGFQYGRSLTLIEGLHKRGIKFLLELPKSLRVASQNGKFLLFSSESSVSLGSLTYKTEWTEISLRGPLTNNLLPFAVAEIGTITFPCGTESRLIAYRKGAHSSATRDTVFVVTSLSNQISTIDLVAACTWARWIDPIRRKIARNEQPNLTVSPLKKLSARPNITTARRQDDSSRTDWQTCSNAQFKGKLVPSNGFFNVIELFAGGGGLGLGFLQAENCPSYRIVFSGEVHPIYAKTLNQNYQTFDTIFGSRKTPEVIVPVDLRTTEAQVAIQQSAARAGQVDFLIGGPPCQGFSASNRNSNVGSNPHNQHIDTFLDYVENLNPSGFLLENVQGILWSAMGKGESVVDYIIRKMKDIGYLVFPKLLDAVWYGVPQHRTRCFILGIHKRLGYNLSDFGSWGPFPLPTYGPGTQFPYTTVRNAFEDLPEIGNGHFVEVMQYNELSAYGPNKNPFQKYIRSGALLETISDHVTSQHAEYVLERYAAIPEGGNWRDVSDLLTNYASRERTHSNIYRRLKWDEPSVTIGHYRKSMLIHPKQNRGLSLREACRLQSFPDWFRFAGSLNEMDQLGGLSHKQQQLANAVCPLVAKAVAETIANL